MNDEEKFPGFCDLQIRRTCMNTFTKLAIYLLMFSGTTFADEGGISGGGGDPLRFYFLRGREIAEAETRNASDQLLGMAHHHEGANWIKLHREELADEIDALRLSWGNPDAIQCAFTEYQPGAVVRLSFKNCRTVSTAEEAGKILIHEAAHHLGIVDHALADEIALAVTEAWERAKVLSVPFCPSTENYMATLIPGSWVVDRPLLSRLYSTQEDLSQAKIVFREDATVAKIFPPLGRCAVAAGYLTLSGFGNRRSVTLPAVLVEMDMNVSLVWFEGPNDDGSPDLESSIMNGARAEDTANDLLFMGGDFNEPGTIPFKRK
jgi:hypothetical protein